MKYDALIFDLDGTLWNTAETVVMCWNKALQDLEIDYPEITVADISKLMGLAHTELKEKFLPGLDPETKERALTQGYKIEEAVLDEHGGTMYDGVSEGLEKLSARYPLYLVSNCQQGYLDAFFRWSKMKRHFKDWECYGNTKNPKHENIKSVISRNELQSPVYIGDTAKDEYSAEAAGIPYFHCNYGFGEPQGDPKRFSSFNELTSFFLAD